MMPATVDCADCVFLTPGGYGIGEIGRCDLQLPGWIAFANGYQRRCYRGGDCHLGRKKEPENSKPSTNSSTAIEESPIRFLEP